MFQEFREMHRDHELHRHRHGHGWWSERGSERWDAFMGGGRERFFDNGHLRLVILQLIADKPSYGYEIIKAIEERLSGGYSPSPGVIYPTLTLLEEEGFATVSSTEGSKKLYAATDAGRELLKANQVLLKAIFGRMHEASKTFGRGRSPQIQRAIMNLKLALKMRLERGALTPEQLSRLAEIIDTAARAVDEL